MTAVLVLASASPRRAALLRSLGLDPVVRPVDIDEAPLPGEAPVPHVARLAAAKADAGCGASDEVVLGADTIVALDDDLLGKPTDARHARTMLLALSGRSHDVHTGVAVHGPGGTFTDVITTRVHMRDLTEAEIDWYLAGDEPFDKAGAYAVQGAGGMFVASVEGSPSNVIGLPLAQTVMLLRSAGLDVAARRP